MRNLLVILTAVLLGVGASLVYFSRDDAAGETAPADDAPVASQEAAFARPPAETFNPVFEPCAHCHQVGDGARHTSGPELNGILGDAAAARDYPYSTAMQQSGLTWDEATLVDFLVNPQDVVPGTRMLLEGLPRDEAERIVDYLKSVDADSSSGRG